MSESSEVTNQAARPPATPIYILRGHAAPIHALHLYNQNLRLISADADGWVIVWDLVMKRPVAAWKAHEGAILEVKGSTSAAKAATDVYTHGRDHKLRVWRFRRQDEEVLQKTLPVEIGQGPQANTASQPWLVHSLPVNALNFCAFSLLFLKESKCADSSQGANVVEESADATPQEAPRSPALIAVPNALNSGAIDLFHLPLERRVCTIPADTTTDTGMVMAVHLFTGPSGDLYVASAYEDGHVMLFARRGLVKEQDILQGTTASWKWEKLYACRPHSQPVLSIDVFPQRNYFLSSSADALLVKHPIPRLSECSHQSTNRPEEAVLKTVNTKHAGQQGLRIRSDGKIFATAGWDSRIRVYSCKTMKELAVLKWHKEGCYTIGLAKVPTVAQSSDSTMDDSGAGGVEDNSHDSHQQVTTRGDNAYTLAAVQHQRNRKVQTTHWLAAGSKDGKISLWDIY
ncbi:ASTRA complex subunit [Aspergillus fumigatus]|nr:ASTRA complex subunit [Aspergillus fumigatus]KAH1636281.1 ASTRA complex subunit [Aspergillus fumigatus]KAH2089224.1 ASTRA complex subunit [Aspergillus fumigatus]KAH2998339.1 ASTRA complex subunit [Aspergillus fumigatus]